MADKRQAGKLAVVMLTMGAVAACGSNSVRVIGAATSAAAAEPGVSTYLCRASTEDDLLQWRQSSENLSGTYQSAQLSGQAPSEQVSANSGDLSGTLDGTAVTLTVGLSQPLYGTLSGGKLSLNVPQSDGTIQTATCNQASISDWNNTVAALNSQAAGDNQLADQAQAQASHDQNVSQAQQSMANDVTSLQDDSATLNNDNSLASAVSQMGQDYKQEQADFQTEQSDSCDSMGGDADTVGGDADTVGGDLDTLDGDITYLQSGEIQTVKSDLANVRNDLSTLHSLGATPAIGYSSAVASGNQALKNAASAISWAQGQGKMINSEAQQLATTAQNYASSHCG